MRDEPQASVDERDPMMESVPTQRSHGYGEDRDGADRAVGTAQVPNGARDAHDGDAYDARDGEFHDDGFRPADTDAANADAADVNADAADADAADADAADSDANAEVSNAGANDTPAVDTAGADIAGSNTAAADAERADAERADADRADAERADADLSEDAASREQAEDRAAHGESAWDNRPAGGVPDDAVSSADAPVPAAAYQTDRDERTDLDAADREAADREAGVYGEEPSGAEAAQSAAAAPDAETNDEAAQGELMPGDVPEQPVSALFDEAATNGFRDRWQRVQMQFVDDPRGATDQARTLVDDVLNALHDGLNNQRGALDGWQSGQPDDTEQLRVAIRRYRDFLDRMLGV
jgi:hypothetical protein